MAHDLVKVYAAREAHGRAPYESADALYQEFAARFPFEETPGQQRAIDEVLADLGGARPMDRLVCGDVGFGKTEVAMRAAFLAVLGGQAGGGARADDASSRSSTSRRSAPASRAIR